MLLPTKEPPLLPIKQGKSGLLYSWGRQEVESHCREKGVNMLDLNSEISKDSTHHKGKESEMWSVLGRKVLGQTKELTSRSYI